VRHTNFGEGEYGQTEQLIRRLLGARGPMARSVADATPTELLTPETYLGYERIQNYRGSQITPDQFRRYVLRVVTAARLALVLRRLEDRPADRARRAQARR
jgi:hypothetical protein